jgi:aerobic carbon-monoxide dehydrogenase medium subunit
MKPAPFRYHAPNSVSETVTLLAELGEDAVVLAGGQSLVPMMNLRLARPSDVIDLNRVQELAYVEARGEWLAIGAMTRHSEAESSAEVRNGAPMLAQALPHVGYPATRARGTVGGSIAHADPAAELPCVLLAGDGVVVLQGSNSSREVPAEDFFDGPFTTRREADELVVELRLPRRGDHEFAAFDECVAKSGDFALAMAAVTVVMDGRTCLRARIAIGGALPVPMRCRDAESCLEERDLSRAAVDKAASIAEAQARSAGDGSGTAEFRAHLVGVEVGRALAAAAGLGGAR